MDTNFLVDSKGNKLSIKSYCTSCTVIITAVLPESRPVDIVCFMPDGYIFGKLRDSEFRGSELLDKHFEVVQADFFKEFLLPRGLDRVYCHIYPTNLRAINWLLSKGWIQDGSLEKEGRIVNRYYLLAERMISNAEAIKGSGF